jgi:hypothetical protein
MNNFHLDQKLDAIDFDDEATRLRIREIIGCHLTSVNYCNEDLAGRQCCRFCGNPVEDGKKRHMNEEMLTAVRHGRGCTWAIAAELLGYEVYRK